MIDAAAVRELQSETLRKRLTESSKGPRTQQWIIFLEGEEVAFLSIDDVPERGCLFLYEVYVDPAQRGRGIGTELLIEVEELAMQKGYSRVVLKPVPLDRTLTREELDRWYEKRGYKPRRELPTELEKHLERKECRN